MSRAPHSICNGNGMTHWYPLASERPLESIDALASADCTAHGYVFTGEAEFDKSTNHLAALHTDDHAHVPQGNPR